MIPTSFCAADFSVCSVFEDQDVLFPDGFIASAGDVVIENGNTTVAVFRVFDDVFDSGGGTGFGDFSFVFSAAFGNLPDPNTYSVNSVFVPLGPDQGNGFDETQYIGAFGTEFDIFTTVPGAAPEPSTVGFLFLGGVLLACRRSSSNRRQAI